MSVTRREFTEGTIASVLTFSLIETLFEGDAFADEIKPIAAQWLESQPHGDLSIPLTSVQLAQAARPGICGWYHGRHISDRLCSCDLLGVNQTL